LIKKIDCKLWYPSHQPNTFSLYRQDETDDNDDNSHSNEQKPIDPEASSPEIDEIPNDTFDDLLLTEPVILKDRQPIRTSVMKKETW